MSKEIHLKNRPSGYADKDFEIVEVEIPEVKKEGEFLVRNIWMSVDPFLRIYMVNRFGNCIYFDDFFSSAITSSLSISKLTFQF